ncbi:MAG TPA: MFS transporter [Lacipirellulaceae bacterium]
MSQPSGDFSRSTAEPASAASSPWHARSLENQVVWTLWLTYGAFYFCRTNISAAVPGMQASTGEGGAGLSSGEVGWILASLKIAYGVGQFINGQLSERISPRVMLALGMFGSAALNVAFGMGAGFYFLLFVWATNGFCQSLGWTPCVRVAANWVPVQRRGNALGIIGTGYQITLGLTYLVASAAADWFGWRGAFYVPAVLLALVGIFMLVALREAPNEEVAKSIADMPTAPLPAAKISLADALYWTLFNPVLWLLGLSLGLLNACRYGFVDWGIAHLMETRNVAVGKAGLQFFVIAIGATAGSYLAGWATDRWFGGRRGPVVCVLMMMLGCLTLVYNGVVQSSVIGSMLLVVAIGFCIYGPQVLLVGTAPADLAHRGTSAAAAGFVNFMGYMGAASGDVVTGYFSAPEHGGWHVAIYIWAGWAFAGAAIMAILWNTTTDKIGVLPGAVPRLAALVMLLAAAAANVYGEQSFALASATIAAAICLGGTSVSRWAAAPLIGIAAAGLLAVFSSYVRSGDVTWHVSLAMAGYALTMICALMILVDRGAERCELL